MSSYNQVTQPTTVGLAIVTAFEELTALRNEMEELSAEIAGMFPETYGRIPKYEQAQIAYKAFNDAIVRGADAGLIDSDRRQQGDWAAHSIMVKVGKQTRQNRATSQRVRLGNAVQRLQSASEMLWKEGAEEHGELEEVIEEVKDVVFPAAHG